MQEDGGTITGSSSGQESKEQCSKKSLEGVSGMSQDNSCKSWGLGTWKNKIKAGEVPDLRKILYATSLSRSQKEFLVWLGSMFGGERAAECLQAMGQTPRVSKGIKNRVDKLRALGNGQVPAVAARAWNKLLELSTHT